MQRLYEAARTCDPPVIGQSNVARALDELPQTVKNWEQRGVSQRGLISAQRVFGADATWIEKGVLSPRPPGLIGSAIWPRPSGLIGSVETTAAGAQEIGPRHSEERNSDIQLPAALDTLIAAIAVLPMESREPVAKALSMLAQAPDSAGWREQALIALQSGDAERKAALKKLLEAKATHSTPVKRTEPS